MGQSREGEKERGMQGRAERGREGTPRGSCFTPPGPDTKSG